MRLNRNIEEALSAVWEFKERKIESLQEVQERLRNKFGEKMLQELLDKKYLLCPDAKIRLSEEGEYLARDIIRRQRLAERLLVDVLEIRGQLLDSAACEFEHVISPEIEKSICTLLGHPKLCPHGSSIPEGECCRQQVEVIKSIIITLDKLKQAERFKVVYIFIQNHPELHKLISFGVAPGATLKIHQTFPTLVIEMEEQLIALDKEIARNIYVKKLQ
jgi:DtxR family Mn-dependent transcriptional regulator